MTGYLSKGTFEGIADRTWTGRVMGQAKWLAEDAMEIGGTWYEPERYFGWKAELGDY
jgi:hypothetical protein